MPFRTLGSSQDGAIRTTTHRYATLDSPALARTGSSANRHILDHIVLFGCCCRPAAPGSRNGKYSGPMFRFTASVNSSIGSYDTCIQTLHCVRCVEVQAAVIVDGPRHTRFGCACHSRLAFSLVSRRETNWQEITHSSF